MQSTALTVDAYLKSLPADRRAGIEQVRQVILRNLDKDYKEGMSYGMIGYYIPHSIFPDGYHCDPRQPLPFAGLASQKNHMSVYIMGLYLGCEEGNESELVQWFRAAWARTGKKLDMGKCCIRFKKAEDLALDVLGEAIRRCPAKTYIETYTALRDNQKPTSRAEIKRRIAARDAEKAAKRAAKQVTKKAAKKTAKKATKKAVKKAAR